MLEVLDRVGTNSCLRAMPASASALSSRRPAGPTNGCRRGLSVARLLAHEHHRCALWPLARHCLSGVLLERTALANVLLRTQRGRLHDRTIVVITICPAFLHRRRPRFVRVLYFWKRVG